MSAAHKFETARVPRPKGERVTLVALAIIFVALALLTLAAAIRERDAILPILGTLVFLGLAAAGLVTAIARPHKVELTEAGRAAKAADEKRQREREAEFFKRPYIRYPIGAIVLTGVAWIYMHSARAPAHGSPWIRDGLLTVATIFGLWQIREIAKWVLLIGGGWLAVDLVADADPKMSTPAAIIVGACIVAYAIFASRWR